MNTASLNPAAASVAFSSQACPAPGTVGPARKILIVDDSVIILRTLSAKLKAAGYQVLTAADGSETVSLVRKERPDLILLDINFPPDVGHGGGVAWDGFLIMSWLRRMDEAMHTPVIIITGSDPATFKDRCLKCGVAGYFQKPLAHDALIESIEKALAKKHDSAGATAAPKKVLFVDDENDWRFMAGIYLNDSGYEVLCAGNGAEAVAKLRQEAPDVVLLDLNLAGESGLDVLPLLKSEKPSVPVVVYTGMDHDAQSIQAILRLGANQYLRKGTMGDMLKAVQNALGISNEPAPLRLRLA